MRPVKLGKKRLSKYRNVETWVDGYRFDSKHEAACYQSLKEARRTGQINYFLRQTTIHLAPGGKHKKTPVLMRIDFQVHYLDGTVRYIDAKGRATQDWLNKASMAEDMYGITIETW